MGKVTSKKGLIDNQDQYKLLFENSLDAVLLTSPEGKIHRANAAACKIFKMTEKELIKKGRNTVVDSSDPRLKTALKKRKKEGKYFGELTFIRKGGEKFPGEISTIIYNDVEGNKRTSMIIRDITERKNLEKQLLKNEELLKRTGKMAKVGGWEFDVKTGKGTWTDEVARIHDLQPGKKTNVILGMSFYRAESRIKIETAIQAAIDSGKSYDLDLEMITAKGRRKWIRTIGKPVKDGKNVVKIQGSFQDITERVIAEEKLIKANRVYAVISQINQLIVREHSKNKLLKEVCNIVIKHGKFKLAWIGVVDRETNLVRPVASAGFDNGYLSEIKKISTRNVPTGRGPTGSAIRKGNHFVCNDIETDVAMKTWRNEALKRGYRSSIALPIKLFGKVVGAFSIYASTPEFFDKKEVGLLMEVAADISFALETIDIEQGRIEAEKAVKNEMEFSNSLLNGLPGIFYFYDQNFNFLKWNKNFEKVSGYSEKEIAGMKPLQFFPEEQKKMLQSKISEVFKKGYSEVEADFCAKDGTRTPYFFTGLKIKFNNYDCLIGVGLDISKRKEVEFNLVESERKYRSLFENMIEGFAYCKMNFNDKDEPIDFTYISVNKAFEKQTGLRNVEGKKVSEIIPGIQKTDPGLFEIYGRVAKGNPPEAFETFVESLDMWFSVSVYSTGSDHFVAVFDVITERKKNEVALTKSEERLRLSTELANVAVWEYDFVSNSMSRSKNHDKLYGLDWQENWDMVTFLTATHPDDRQFSNEHIMKSVSPDGQDEYKFDFRTIHPDNSIHWLEVIGQVVERNSKGEGIIVRGCLIDVTERKNAEILMRESEERFRTAFEHSASGMCLTTMDGKISRVNKSLCNILNYEREELEGQHFNTITFSEDYNIGTDSIKMMLSGKLPSVTFEKRYLKKDGSYIWAHINSSVLWDLEGNPKYFITQIEDFTERMLASEKLRLSEERFHNAFYYGPTGLTITRISDGNFLNVNEAFLKMFEYSRDEVIGRSSTELSMLSQEGRKKLIQNQIETGGLENAELVARSKSGKLIDILFSSKPMNIEGELYHITTMINITERKQAEKDLELLMNRLIESEELMRKSAADQLHDQVGQNLTALTINLTYIKSQLSDESKDKNEKRLDDSISILNETVEQIRNIMVELQPPVLDDYGLSSAINWSIDKFKERTGINVVFKDTGYSNRLPLNIESSLFRVFQEILHNIAKHSKAENVDVNLEGEGDIIKLLVKDDGEGFDTHKMIDKKEIKGFGLMSISERIRFMGGKLIINSKPGLGTTIEIEIRR